MRLRNRARQQSVRDLIWLDRRLTGIHRPGDTHRPKSERGLRHLRAGATLFCLVTGHPAVERREGEAVVAHFLRVASAPVSDLAAGCPEALTEIVQRAMAIEPSDRPRTAAELGEQLRDLQRGHGHKVIDMALLAEEHHSATGG